MRFLGRILGRTPRERTQNVEALGDEVPHRGARVDDPAREEFVRAALEPVDRRDVIRLGAVAGGGVLAALVGDRLFARAAGTPGDGIAGTTISDTDVDAKRIAGIRIATEFASAKHAGTDSDPWPGSAIQAALDDLPTTGGMVYVPLGSYNVADPLSLAKSNVALIGSGYASRLWTNGTGFTANASGMIEIVGQFRGIHVEKLSLDGTNTDTCRGILIQGGTDAFVDGCHFSNWKGVLTQRGRGLTVVHNPATEGPPWRTVVVTNCTFTGNQVGAVFHRTLFVMHGCVLYDQVWDGIYTEGVRGGRISDNVIQKFGRNGVNVVFPMKNSISGNQIEDGSGDGITAYDADYNIITENRIVRCATPVGLRSNSNNNYVVGNILEGTIEVNGTGNVTSPNIQVPAE